MISRNEHDVQCRDDRWTNQDTDNHDAMDCNQGIHKEWNENPFCVSYTDVRRDNTYNQIHEKNE